MKPRVLVLYEYSVVGLAYSTAHIRLLRPLAHPTVQDRFEVLPAAIYTGQSAEVVIVDRTWRPEINPEMANVLIDQIHTSGAKLLYQIDDDLLSLPLSRSFTAAQRDAVVQFLHGADTLLVSTPVLAERMAAFSRRIYTVPNALDERLIAPCMGRARLFGANQPVIIGYMGTMTHDGDLRLIVDALVEAHRLVETPFELEIIGVIYEEETWRLLRSLPFPVRKRDAPTVEYPHFMAWFTSEVHWDIGLAPLRDTPFNRCKSDVKFLDYSAAGIPGIFSNGTVYTPTVVHGVTGWLADAHMESWRDALLKLIASPELRRQIAANAQRQLLQERTLGRCGREWTAVLEAVLYG